MKIVRIKTELPLGLFLCQNTSCVWRSAAIRTVPLGHG